MSVATPKQEQAIITPLTEDHLANPAYTPTTLLDTLMSRCGLKNDAHIARTLMLPPPVISKIRHKQASVTSAILLRIHDVTGWSVSDIRALMGIKSTIVNL